MPPKSAKPATPETAAAAADSPENLDKVRDILFGAHMRSVEGRIARVEERLLREQSALRSDLETALAGLEAFTRKELDALNEKVKTEREKRTEDLKALGADLREAIKALDRRLAKLDEATSGADADLRTQMIEQKRAGAADLKQAGDQIMAELRRAQQELRSEKADLAAVVAAFSEMAVRLSERLPDKPKK
jgi:DNA repair exonuclease SbcCD ATPase subunit